MVEHLARGQHSEHGVVEDDEADGDEERSPVLIERQDADHHEEVEVGLDEAAGEVHDHGRGHHQAEGGHGRGEPPAPAVGGGQAGEDGDQAGLGHAVDHPEAAEEAVEEDHRHVGPQQVAQGPVADPPHILG